MIVSYRSSGWTDPSRNVLVWANYRANDFDPVVTRRVPVAACHICWRLLKHCMGLHLGLPVLPKPPKWLRRWILTRPPAKRLQNSVQVYRQHRQRRRRQWARSAA